MLLPPTGAPELTDEETGERMREMLGIPRRRRRKRAGE